ncbi:MAG: DUF1800 family protein [Verrucomicrobiota bacterium]
MKTPTVLPSRFTYLHCVSKFTLVSLLLAGFATIPEAFAQVDLDTDDDNLLDAWEIQHFGALNHADGDPTDDPDGDGCDNQSECDASTDPNDPTDCLTIVDSNFSPDNAVVCWPSVRGKRYNIQVSDDLNTWTTLSDSGGTTPLDFRGTGGTLKADFSNPVSPRISGAVTRELYIGNVTGSLASLIADPDYPNNPDGKEWLSETRSPSEDGSNYGQRISGYIAPKESGNFTFYIAGRHQCEFFLSSDETPANLGPRKAWLLNSNLFEQLDWDFLSSYGLNDTQQSAEIALTAGNRYYFEIRHQHQGQLDHLAVGWEGPGTNGIEIIDGDCVSPVEDYSNNNAAILFHDGPKNFARVVTYGPLDPSTDQVNPDAFDTDGDGVDDATEIGLGGYSLYNGTSSGGADGATLAASGTANPDNDIISAATIDGIAREDVGFNNNGTPRYQDHARFSLNRSGSLESKTLFFTLTSSTDSNKGTAGDEDYNVTDLEGGEISSSGGTYAVTLPFGANQVQIEIDPELDEFIEYPEEVSLNLIGGASTAVCEIEDARDSNVDTPDSDENFDNEFVLYYIAEHSPEPGVSNPGDAPTGAAFLILSASRRYARIDNQYNAFTSNETNSHIHRAIPGTFTNGGPVVKDIPNMGGGGGSADYRQENFFWDLASQIGALSPISVQDLIDSLEFDKIKQQNPVGTPFLYVNVHTANNGGGETWAPFRRANASTDPPEERVEPTPAIEPIDPLTEEKKLRREIRRFLTQATFGATQQTEEELYLSIMNDHAGDRIAGFDAWLTAQWAMPQTLCADLTMALDMQEWVLRGVFLAGASGRSEPGNWPNFTSTDISNFDSLNASTWRRPDTNYPLSQNQINNAKNNPSNTGEPNFNNRRRAQWMIWLYGKDQLRQRIGAALQEIMVISAEATDIRNHHIGTARYIDMLAENADDHFRELLEDVTYSPQMGKYLSHLQNSRESSSGVPPDENYAREIMQLFSIGLLDLWDDGFIKLDPATKNITQTYDNNGITELAKVMTGLSWATNSASQNNWDTPNIHTDLDVVNNTTEDNWYDDGPGNKYYSSRYNYPMIMYRGEHENSNKTIAGGKVISNNQTTSGRYPNEGHKDLRDVHNYFAGTQNDATGPKTFAATWGSASDVDGNGVPVNHQNTPSFISRLLIQRLVTSNPSPDYLYRVAQAWRNTNGQLDAVVRAILLDPEARNISDAEANIEYGKKKEPIIAYLQAIRALNGRTHIALDGSVIQDSGYAPFDLIGAADGLDPRVLPGITLTQGGTLTPIQDAQLGHFQYPASQLNNFQGSSKYDSMGQLVNTGGSNFQNYVATQTRYGRTDTGTTSQLRQTPLRAPTVFNWFLPDYQPGGLVASYGLFAPEFQIADENSVIQNVNYYWTLGWGTTGQSVNQLGGNNTNQIAAGYNTRLGNGTNYYDDNIILDYWTWMNKWNNYPDIPANGLSNEQDKDLQLIEELDDLLNAGRMQAIYTFDPTDDVPAGNQGAFPHFANRNPLEVFVHVLTDSYGTSTNNVRDKIRLAFYLMLSSPEYLTQK